MVHMNHSGSILHLKNILFGYDYHSPVIDGVTLAVPKGGFIGVLGPSGSGKSTLLKLIAGLYKPWEGSIIFSKSNTTKNKTFPVIGYSPQVEGIDWDFPVTVRELVSIGIWNSSGFFPWINKTVKTKIDSLLNDLGIGGYAQHQIKELSGGEQKRVFLARALIHNPDILVLDEPTAGLDIHARIKFWDFMRSYRENNNTTIFTTHYLEEAEALADKILFLQNGNLREVTIEELKKLFA